MLELVAAVGRYRSVGKIQRSWRLRVLTACRPSVFARRPSAKMRRSPTLR